MSHKILIDLSEQDIGMLRDIAADHKVSLQQMAADIVTAFLAEMLVPEGHETRNCDNCGNCFKKAARRPDGSYEAQNGCQAGYHNHPNILTNCPQWRKQ